jgi:phage terminase Nu1 subunit (DNA packaging protein)
MSKARRKGTGARTLTRRQLAAAMGVRPGQITRWQDDGMPVAVKGGPGKSALYDLAGVKAWRAARPDPSRPGGVSVAEETALLKRTQTERAQLEIQRRRGELLDRALWVRACAEHITHAKARLLSLPSALAARAVHAAQTGGPAAVQLLLETAIRESLVELAGMTSTETA